MTSPRSFYASGRTSTAKIFGWSFSRLQHSDPNDPDWVRELTKDEVSFHQAVRVLSSHGLVEVDTCSQGLIESRGYSIHGCVHSWIIHVLNRAWDHGLARLAVKFVGSHVPAERAVEPWLTQRRILQHAAQCTKMILNGLSIDNGMLWACHELGHYSQGKLVEAEQMYQQALQGFEKAWGPDHTSALGAVNGLGLLCANQGKLVKAERVYQRALRGYEKALGADNIITYVPALNTMWGFGSLFERQADIAKARTMYSKASLGYEKVFGPEHPKSQRLRRKLCALDAVVENRALVGV